VTPSRPDLDAIVIGSGPNGLSAAIALARAGRSVRLYEAAASIGGGMRSDALTEPGCIHDVCATVFSTALVSPFLTTLPLAEHGLEFAHPEAPFAHPLDDGTAVVLERSVDATADALDRNDAPAYRSLMTPIVFNTARLMEALLAPPNLKHPFLMASFGLKAIQSAAGLARRRFSGVRARAMFAGAAAHSLVPLEFAATAGYGFGLTMAAHAVGWPVVRGGSQNAANAMASYFRALGGEVVTGQHIESLAQLPPARAVLCDVSPRQLLSMAGDAVPATYRRRLERFRAGPGVFKMDWALNSPVPWRARECARVGTIHLGGTLEEIAASERASWNGKVPLRPYVLVVQPTMFDPSRAPASRHTLWAYCHVPHGCTVDMTQAIEDQIERYAPGFRDCISTRHTMGPSSMERRNPNLTGGDITGGAGDLRQIFARPVLSLDPYRTPIDGVYLCSASTPPGVGVHGMCGYWAAQSVLGPTN
jgi:phytoene dehydrogenase-like protein